MLVTAFEDNPLATLVLTGGRRLCALVGNPVKADTVGRQVKGALATAMTAGWFKEVAQSGVALGGSVLPPGFPSHNMPQDSLEGVGRCRSGYDEDDDSGDWNLDFAKQIASDNGFEIRVSGTVSYAVTRYLVHRRARATLICSASFFFFCHHAGDCR